MNALFDPPQTPWWKEPLGSGLPFKFEANKPHIPKCACVSYSYKSSYLFSQIMEHV